MSDFYDGTKLLSMRDINGRKPEIYICTTNRTAGKTTYFGRLCVNRFLDKKGKFALIYRHKYDIDDVKTKFFNDLHNLFFPGLTMTEKKRSKGVYSELFLNGESCGYAIPLNSSVAIKTISHVFCDVERMLFDEFQPETNMYLPNEIQKFISIHTSIARGRGEHVRYVPVYMIANAVSLINPYYVEFGISSRINSETKFLRGDGFILEQGYIETAAKQQRESGFNRAFKGNNYVSYAAENVYLNDSLSFIEQPAGKSKYMCTIKYNGSNYGVREFADSGIIYCNNKPDLSFPIKIAITTEDHNINYVILKRNDFLLSNMRYFFERGCFRFKDLRCKEAILKAVSY